MAKKNMATIGGSKTAKKATGSKTTGLKHIGIVDHDAYLEPYENAICVIRKGELERKTKNKKGDINETNYINPG